ncbi:response regulator transcription factor [uncultured Algibacter sp.]|uniref:LytR/AlgR family response regulator transcription factor n=1 Tax=uncultured Algibacter sp. TaxID=298659 RepID=UPI0026312D3A|nr:response regulator transcription factor [uncultured Algibacter sp.]
MKIRSIIIEDEPLAIEVIKSYLKEFPTFELCATFSNAIDGLAYLKDNSVDVIFLDINMPLLDGLSFIKNLSKKPLIVITSAYKEYAVESYDLEVFDYLMKPIEFSRFVKTVNKITNVFESKSNTDLNLTKRPYIFIKIDKKKLQKIYIDEILVVESLKDYLKIKTESGRFIIHQTLSAFTDLLPDNFIRIHRSFTIAINKIDSLEANSLEIDGIRYTIGRTYVEKVKDKILRSGMVM